MPSLASSDARRAEAAALATRLFCLTPTDATRSLMERSAQLLDGGEAVRACHDWLVGESLPRVLERRGQADLAGALRSLGHTRVNRAAAVALLTPEHRLEPCSMAVSMLSYTEAPAVLNNVRRYLHAFDAPAADDEGAGETWSLLVRLLDMAPSTDDAAVVSFGSGLHGIAWREGSRIAFHEGPLDAALAALPPPQRARLEPLVPPPRVAPARISTPSRRYPASCAAAGLGVIGERVWIARPYGIDVLSLPDLAHVETWPLPYRADGIAVSPGGLWIAVLTEETRGNDKRITVLDVAGAPRASWGTTEYGHAELIASLDGSRLAVIGSIGARVWSLDGDGRPTETESVGCGTPLAFSPDGGLVFSGREAEVVVRSLPDGAEIRRIAAKHALISAIGVSPDGRHLAVASYDRPKPMQPRGPPALQIVDLASGKTHSLRCGPGAPVRLAFAPGGELVVADDDGCFSTWDLENGALRRTVRFGVGGRPRVVACGSAAAPLLLMSFSNDSVSGFDLRTGLVIAREAPPLGHVEALGFTGDVLVTREQGSERSGKPDVLRAFAAPDGTEVPLPEGSRLAFPPTDVCAERGLRALCLRSGRSFHDGWGTSLPDESVVALADADGTEIARLADHRDLPMDAWIEDAAYVRRQFSPDGALLLSVGVGTARLWCTTTHACRHVFGVTRDRAGPEGYVIDHAWFDVSGRGVVATGHRGEIPETRLYDAGDGSLRGTASVASSRVVGHFERGLLAFAFEDGHVELWDAGRSTLRWSAAEHRSHLRAIAIDASGERLATVDADSVVRVWDTGDPR